MTILPWTEQYSVDIRKIDNQHKILLDYLNKLYDIILGETENEDIVKIIDDMTIHAISQFRSEEQLMFSTGYPKYSHHKLQHKHLIKQLGDLREKYCSDGSTELVELTNFLKDWLVDHIMGSDKSMGKFLVDYGVY